jgi:putative oxidoreductase
MDVLFQTNADWAGLVARLVLGLVILPHGAQKLLGWFGGYGFKATMGYFTQNLRIPYPFALLAIAAEFFGGLALIAGLFGRVAALGVGVVMIVAALKVHQPHGFFMNWLGNQKGEGYEFHLLAAALALVVLIGGSGAWSLDQVIAQWLASAS